MATQLEKIQSAEIGSIAVLEDDEEVVVFFRGDYGYNPCWFIEGCQYPIADLALMPVDGQVLTIQPPDVRAEWIVEDD